jgi:hypothetical protein
MKTGPMPEDQPFANPLNLPAESQSKIKTMDYNCNSWEIPHHCG